MKFNRMEDALDFISRLPDRPSLSEGYTPEKIKAEFDKGVQALKEYINEDLLRQLEANGAGSSAAERLGSATIRGLKGKNVYDQLAALKELADTLREDLNSAVTGAIPDGSLGEEKLTSPLRDLLHAKESHGFRCVSYTQRGAYTFITPRAGLYRIRLVGGGGAGTLINPLAQPVGSYDCHGGASGACGEFFRYMEKGARMSMVIGQGAFPRREITLGQVLDTQEMEEGHFEWLMLSQEGGSTEIYFTNDIRVVAEGGSREGGPVGVRTYELGDTPVMCYSGAHQNPWGQERIAMGADSLLGQGGRRGKAPGNGGGGEGGRIRFETETRFVVEKLPTAGGDGAVFIEYIGGDENAQG